MIKKNMIKKKHGFTFTADGHCAMTTLLVDSYGSLMIGHICPIVPY